MVSDDEREFRDLIAGLFSVFAKDFDEVLFGAWWTALEDLPLERVAHGIKRALRECKWMPAAAEIRSLAGCLTMEERATLAFQSAKEAVKRVGPYSSVTFDDPVVNATIRLVGGWTDFCDASESGELDRYVRPRFLKAYITLANRGIRPSEGAYLVGIHESNNRRDGYPVEGPQCVLCNLPPHDVPPIRLKDSKQREQIRHVAKNLAIRSSVGGTDANTPQTGRE